MRVCHLAGPSGCGKTTLLNIIAEFLRPTSGSLTLDDENIGDVPPKRRDSAMRFQSYELFPHLSVRENVTFGPRQKGELHGWKLHREWTRFSTKFRLRHIRTSSTILFPEDINNERRWPMHWRYDHGSCCFTNRFPTSMRSLMNI